VQGWTFERLIDVRSDCAGFVERKIAVLKDRHAIEWMQCEVAGGAHFRLEITERVWDSFVREHQPNDMDVSAAWKTKYDDVGHDGAFA
jgi:hypothetical protein